MVNFELGKNIEKDVFRRVTSVGQNLSQNLLPLFVYLCKTNLQEWSRTNLIISSSVKIKVNT